MCDECTELSLAVHASRVDETSEASERQTTDSARSDFWAEETLSGEGAAVGLRDGVGLGNAVGCFESLSHGGLSHHRGCRTNGGRDGKAVLMDIMDKAMWPKGWLVLMCGV